MQLPISKLFCRFLCSASRFSYGHHALNDLNLKLDPGSVGVSVESGTGRVVCGLTPCQDGWGRVGVWRESGTGRGRIGVDFVSSWEGSGRGPGRVGDGSGQG